MTHVSVHHREKRICEKMLEAKEKEINGTRYRVSQLPFREGRALLQRLFRIFAPVLGQSLKGLDSKDAANLSLGEIKLSALGDGLSILAETLTGSDFDSTCDLLAAHTQVNLNGTSWVSLKDVMDIHFAGKYLHMMKWLTFALEVNFSDFLEGSGGLKGLAARAHQTGMASPSPSQTM